MGAPCEGSVFVVKNHYPRSREHFFIPLPHRHAHAFGGLGLEGALSPPQRFGPPIRRRASHYQRSTAGVGWLRGNGNDDTDTRKNTAAGRQYVKKAEYCLPAFLAGSPNKTAPKTAGGTCRQTVLANIHTQILWGSR